MRKRILLILACLAIPSVIAILVARSIVDKNAANYIADDSSDLPSCKVAVVLGCSSTLSDGRPNQFFQNRIQKAADLYHCKRVSKLIVSGDNSRTDYNEPEQMKEALIKKGVPADAIVCDYAGFSTLDSVVRAKEVFGQTQFIVISQAFHNTRAVFIARSKGIEAYGLNAADVHRAHSARTMIREELARVKSVLDIWILDRDPKFLGPKISI